MSIIFIIANVLSFIGNTFFSLSSIFKNKRTILSFQTVNFVLSTTSEVLQKAWSGFAQDSMNLIKAIILLFVDKSKKKVIITVNIICMTISFVGGIILNVILSDNIWYGYFPVVSTLIFSTCVLLAFVLPIDELKEELLMKIALLINGTSWGIYGFFIKLYPVIFFNIVLLILTIIAIVRILINMKKAKK